ncbi:unnamed protein product, partial [Trichogramma brassicae]
MEQEKYSQQQQQQQQQQRQHQQQKAKTAAKVSDYGKKAQIVSKCSQDSIEFYVVSFCSMDHWPLSQTKLDIRHIESCEHLETYDRVSYWTNNFKW